MKHIPKTARKKRSRYGRKSRTTQNRKKVRRHLIGRGTGESSTVTNKQPIPNDQIHTLVNTYLHLFSFKTPILYENS